MKLFTLTFSGPKIRPQNDQLAVMTILVAEQIQYPGIDTTIAKLSRNSTYASGPAGRRNSESGQQIEYRELF